jgi:hypothetical protein
VLAQSYCDDAEEPSRFHHDIAMTSSFLAIALAVEPSSLECSTTFLKSSWEFSTRQIGHKER